MKNNKKPPVKPDQKLSLMCERLGTRGDGIFMFNNYVIMAKGAEVGKTYNLRINRVLPRFAFAEVV